MSPEATVIAGLIGSVLAALAFCALLNWFHAVKVREFQRGAEYVKRESYRYVANCSLAAHQKALLILRPKGWRD